jgi:hypothetical protein
VGGMVGSFLGQSRGGKVGGVAGAAAGGALGKGAEMLIDSQPQSFGEGARAMGRAAVEQGAGQAVGVGVGKGLTMLGKGAYLGGVGLLPKTLKQGYATATQTGTERLADAGFAEGIPLTAKGAAKAGGKIAEVSTKVHDKLSTLQRAGASPVQAREVAASLRPVRDTFVKRAELGLPDETPNLAGRVKAMRAQSPGGIPLTRAQELKREAQALADSAYKSQAAGHPINSGDMLTNKAVASGLREAIERRAPDVAPLNERMQGLIGLRDGAEHASGTGHILSRLGGAGVMGGIGVSGGGIIPGLLAGGAGLAMTTPGGATSTGLALKAAAPYAQVGAARIAALLAALSGEQ